jgi:hypothetical protein
MSRLAIRFYRALCIALILFGVCTTLASSTAAGVVVVVTPTGSVTHNYTNLSGGTSPGGIGYGYEFSGDVVAFKASTTYTTVIVAPSGISISSSSGGPLATWTDGALPNTTGTADPYTSIITGGSGSFTIDTGLTGGGGNTGLSANQTYTFNAFVQNYCSNATWTVSADDNSFTPQSGTISQNTFSRQNNTISVQFTTAAANSGMTFSYVNNGANCDGANAFIGLQGYTLTTGAVAPPDGTPSPSPSPSATPTPPATPTPQPSTSPTTIPLIPGGGQYNGTANLYGRTTMQVPLTMLEQNGQTADMIQVYSPGQAAKVFWLDSNGILHTIGGTTLLAYDQNGNPINAPHIVMLYPQTPSTAQTGCGPYYPTGMYYCATITLPTGVAAFTAVNTNLSSFGVNGIAQTNGNGVWFSPLGGTLFNANWANPQTVYVGSSTPSQPFTLELIGY